MTVRAAPGDLPREAAVATLEPGEAAAPAATVGAAAVPSEAATVVPPSRWWQAGPLAATVAAVTVAVLYAAGAELAWKVFVGLVFFPPAGVTTTALLLARRTWWPALAAAAFVAEASVDVVNKVPLRFALGYAAANTIEPLVGATLFRRLRPATASLVTRRDVAIFVVSCSIVGPVCAGMVGAAVRVLQSGGPWPLFAMQWGAGDGIAVLVVASTVLLVAEVRHDHRWRREALLALPLMFGMSLLAVSTSLPSALFCLPVFAWVALRLGAAGVAIQSLVFAVVANYVTSQGHGPFAALDMTNDSRLAWMQVFIAALAVSFWLFAIEADGRRAAVDLNSSLALHQVHDAGVIRFLQAAVRPRARLDEGSLEIATTYRPAGQAVGGDWYDAFELGDGSVLFEVGDVVGHGLVAVEDMVQLRYAARTLALAGMRPAKILGELSQLTASATAGGYATTLVCLYEPGTASLSVSSAGHLPGIVRRADGRVETIACRSGAPLGVDAARARYVESRFAMAVGDAVALYTDGLVERRDRSLDEGIARLTNLVRDAPGVSARELCDELAAECLTPELAFDDACVLVVRRTR